MSREKKEKDEQIGIKPNPARLPLGYCRLYLDHGGRQGDISVEQLW